MSNRMQILLVAATIVVATTGALCAESSRTDATVEKGSKPEPVRARQIYGVHCRLRANRTQWQASEIPTFKAYIHGPGNSDLWLATVVDQRFQILRASATSGEVTPSDQRRQQVMELFRSYVQQEPVFEGDKKLGLRTDLRSFHNWRPAFSWHDIPVLLELAEDDQLMNGMPKLVISSYIGGRCRQGMIALWFIEGLRREQMSQVRQAQVGERQHPASSRLPLNPICVKEGMKLNACESSAEIHREVLRVYQAWWRSVGGLSAGQAAVLYPLDLTDLEWFGGGERWREQPLKLYGEVSADRTVAQRTVRQWKYADGDYKPAKVLQTVYYTPKDPTATAPFNRDRLVVQKVLLHFYDDKGKEIRTESIVPLQ